MAKKPKEEIPKRKHRIPRVYINEIGKKISETASLGQPEENIRVITNSVQDVYCTGYADGYIARIDDAKNFNDRRDARRKISWDDTYNYFEDQIHSKNIQK